MKKTCTVSFAILSFFLSAAQIPNNSFELWTNAGTYYEPFDWASLNPSIAPTTGQVTVDRVTDAKNGMYAAKIKVAETSTLGNIRGRLGLGVKTNYGASGIAYTQKSTLLSLWNKYDLKNNDSAAIFVTLSKWNSTTSKRDIVGSGVSTYKGTQSTYNAASVSIAYTSTETPDTLSIDMVVADNTPGGGSAGSYMIVDDVVLSGSSSIHEKYTIADVKVFPNPAKEIIQIQLPEEHADAKVSITDISGRELYRGTNMTVDLSAFVSGCYFVNIAAGELRAVKKFVIE